MNRLVLFVTAIGVSTLAVYAIATSEDSDEEIAVATVPQQMSGPAPALVALPQPVKKAMPTDFPSLAREIQRELRRVGCYRGEINGLWTAQTRTAMKAFVDDANAVLPVDQPDQVLLSLLQGEHGTACGPSCPAGQQQTADGACVAATVATNSATVTGSIDRKESEPMESVPVAAAVAPHVPTPPLTAREPDNYTAPLPVAEPPLETAALDNPSAPSATESNLVPPPVVSPAKPKRTARYRNRPPKFVRSLFRNIKRSLAPLGF